MSDNNADFPNFKRALDLMGGNLIEPRLEMIELPEGVVDINIENLKTRGIEINAEDIRNIKTRGDEGLFAYVDSAGNEYQVVLYIDKPRKTQDEIEQGPYKNTPRFHFKFCKTLEQMEAAGRYEERYIMTNNPSAEFTLIPQNPFTREHDEDEQFEIQIYPCQNCLTEIYYEGFHMGWSRLEREKFVREFILRDFFDHYGPYFEKHDYQRLNRQPAHAQRPPHRTTENI